MIRARFLVSLLSILTGCVTPQPPTASDFHGIEAPPKGFARVYLLRPAFNALSKSDSPPVQLDGVDLFRLQYGAYAPLQLRPGSHRLSIRPDTFESKLWLADYDFSVESDKTYFLAIWNDVEYHSGSTLVPVIAKVPFVIPISQTTAQNRALRIEFVNQEDVVPVLKTLRLVERQTSSTP